MKPTKWTPPKIPKNVLIADWWDRSPCFWICDLTRLDESDPIQAQYKKAVVEAVRAMSSFYDDGLELLCAGSGLVPEGASWSNGRPDEVKHADVLPPCQIDAYILLHYPS